MSFAKRAFLHLIRKPAKTCLLLLVMVLISTLLLSSLLIQRTSAATMDDLHRQLMTTFSIERDGYNAELYDWSVFATGDIENYYSGPRLTQELYDDIMATEGVTGGNWEQRGLTFFEIAQPFTPVAGQNMYYYNRQEVAPWEVEIFDYREYLFYATMVYAYENENSELQNFFTTGSCELAEGRHIAPDDVDTVLVSTELAELNGWKVGDTIQVGTSYLMQSELMLWEDPEALELLSSPETFGQREFYYSFPLQIVGLFDVKIAARGDEEEDGLSEGFMPQNMFITSSNAADKIYEALGGDPNNIMPIDQEMRGDQMTFSVEDAEILDDVIAQIKAEHPETELLRWTTNDNAFAASTAPIAWMNKLIKIAIYVLIGTGLMLLVLVLLFWSRSRRREAGILLGSGISRGSILAQHLTEGVALALVAVLLSILPAVWIGQAMEEKLMDIGAVQSSQAELLAGDTTGRGMSGDLYMRDTFKAYRNFAPEDVEITLDLTTVGIAAAMMLLGTLVAIILANVQSFIYKPKQLLAQKQ